MQNHLIKNTSKNGGDRAPIEERSSSLFPWMIKASITHHNIALLAKPSLCRKPTSKQEQILRRTKQTITIHQPRQNLGGKRKRKEQDKESTAHLRRGRGLPWPRRSRRRPPPPPRPLAGSTPRGGPARRRPSTRTRPAASGDSSPYCGQRPTAPSTRPPARPARG